MRAVTVDVRVDVRVDVWVEVRFAFAFFVAAVLGTGCVSGARVTLPGDDASAPVVADLGPDLSILPYLPDLAGLDLTPVPPADCKPCMVTGPGVFCGLTVGITPFVNMGGPFGGFQSMPGTGVSSPITITISQPIKWVSVAILDPSYDGNEIRTYDAQGNLVSTIPFGDSGMAGIYSTNMQGIGGTAIVKVVLWPAPLDYVAYENLMVIPAGCEPPIT